ncbi:radical SAM/SPASM domain-containing protein [Flavisolibacter ginsenosidimutans]|uniref:Radical SAM protein n=1 Tax=Flavisolibacter ginsenosidimutans TaxID=661481 RepID=A0A5B8UKW2_9BACT|nr:radical SAM protein [Flavisolibacter ginsenosidimutans]QEC56660.1 radical SAM protein [Flavisolibacter ginsenosidimutans]
MFQQSLYHTFKRYCTLQSHTVSALPIVILMPHSACNCRCVMCDIWKGNKNLKQLTEADVKSLLSALKKFGTQQVLMSGGEALLNPAFFSLCEILKKTGIKITLLSTGLALKKNATRILQWVDDMIVSLDGPEELHDRIRNVPGAFAKMQEGIECLKGFNPTYRITARTVIHQLNFKSWPAIVDAAKTIHLNQISFLPADVSSHAFNREVLWGSERQNEILIAEEELPLLEDVAELIVNEYAADFENRFITESPAKLRDIVAYYKAVHGLDEFPFKKCNAPWVSAVIEADGSVKPCFFHAAFGNIREQSLTSIINGEAAKSFRKNLSTTQNETCKRCVCSLHLSPRTNPASR